MQLEIQSSTWCAVECGSCKNLWCLVQCEREWLGAGARVVDGREFQGVNATVRYAVGEGLGRPGDQARCWVECQARRQGSFADGIGDASGCSVNLDLEAQIGADCCRGCVGTGDGWGCGIRSHHKLETL